MERYVETPLDLGTVHGKLRAGKYKEPDAFRRDVRVVWANCKRSVYLHASERRLGQLQEVRVVG